MRYSLKTIVIIAVIIVIAIITLLTFNGSNEPKINFDDLKPIENLNGVRVY